MTINATAMWLMALYQVVAEQQGADITKLTGTIQNDIVKEYLSRGTYIFPPGPSMRLTTDVIAYTVTHLPKWNPINICSYHLQEAGATPVQEIAFAMCTAICVLDAVRDSGQVPAEKMGDVVARISFFVNAGVRFVEEMCKVRAFAQLWDQVTKERYGITDPKSRRFRYGVQVNSLGLTEAQPENNVQRIVLEMLAVTLSRDARARAVQLPAWNEALGLPRPWDQQWSLRIQQVLAFESDLLEYGDLFSGSAVVAAKTAELLAGAEAEIARVLAMGGVIPAVESGYLKAQLVASHAARHARIESGADKVVGVNCFTTSEPSPLTADLDAAVQQVDPAAEQEIVASLGQWREQRDQTAVLAALDRLRADAAQDGVNLMAASLACARAGVTTGEWSFALRDVFGEYRAPTGVSGSAAAAAEPDGEMITVRAAVAATAEELGAARLRLLVGKPGHGRALQRRRADRAAGPRRRVRGDLPGHPAHPGADRLRRGNRGRALRGAVDPLRFARPARARGTAPAAPGRGGGPAGGRRRDHPGGRRRDLAGRGCGRRLHPQGLRHHRHHRPHRRRDPARQQAPAVAGPAGPPGREGLRVPGWTRRSTARLAAARPQAHPGLTGGPAPALPTSTATCKGWRDPT